MEKQKNTELNFLYQDEKNKKKPYKRRQNSKNKKSKRADVPSAPERERFNFDNEIVIGVTKIPKQNVKSNKQINNKRNRKNTNQSTNTRRNGLNRGNKKKTLVKSLIKWTILLCALTASIIFFMMSPLFNIVEVEVLGNEKLQADTIISLSQITLGDNIYKTSKKNIQANVKENAYIQEVDVKRKLPNKMIITIEERKATYMLEYANSYAYINNQGYILEISQEKLNVPIITGYSTKEEDIKVGNRLYDEDLEKLATVLRIVDSANSNEIGNFITRISIQDKQNYTLIMEEKKKTVYLGDASNLSNRMIYLKAILTGEEGIEGEIFVNGDLNKENAFFRMKE